MEAGRRVPQADPRAARRGHDRGGLRRPGVPLDGGGERRPHHAADVHAGGGCALVHGSALHRRHLRVAAREPGYRRWKAAASARQGGQPELHSPRPACAHRPRPCTDPGRCSIGQGVGRWRVGPARRAGSPRHEGGAQLWRHRRYAGPQSPRRRGVGPVRHRGRTWLVDRTIGGRGMGGSRSGSSSDRGRCCPTSRFSFTARSM